MKIDLTKKQRKILAIAGIVLLAVVASHDSLASVVIVVLGASLVLCIYGCEYYHEVEEKIADSLRKEHAPSLTRNQSCGHSYRDLPARGGDDPRWKRSECSLCGQLRIEVI